MSLSQSGRPQLPGAPGRYQSSLSLPPYVSPVTVIPQMCPQHLPCQNASAGDHLLFLGPATSSPCPATIHPLQNGQSDFFFWNINQLISLPLQKNSLSLQPPSHCPQGLKGSALGPNFHSLLSPPLIHTAPMGLALIRPPQRNTVLGPLLFYSVTPQILSFSLFTS